MKELEEPWVHWESSKLQRLGELPSAHDLRNVPELTRGEMDTKNLYAADARHLEHIVKKGVNKWFETRWKMDSVKTDVTLRVNQWISHILLNTSFNVAASVTLTSELNDNSTFPIPPGFFFNRWALTQVLSGVPSDNFRVSTEYYETARGNLGLSSVYRFAKRQGENHDVAVEDEGQAPWKVITPSYEDRAGLEKLLKETLLPKNVVTAMLMVDFCNPVFSWRRAALMRYIPSQARRGPAGGYDLHVGIVANIEKSAGARESESPEFEFLHYLHQKELSSYCVKLLQEYTQNITKNLQISARVQDYLLLAESRRRIFRPPPITSRPQHSLAEFPMTLPYACKIKPGDRLFEMAPTARIRETTKPPSHWHPRNTQTDFLSTGCPFSIAL